MNYLDILQEKVEAKKKEFGGLSPYSISCNDVLGLIQAAKAAQQSVQPTLLESRDLNLFCPLCGGQFDIELPAPQSG